MVGVLFSKLFCLVNYFNLDFVAIICNYKLVCDDYYWL